MSRIADLRSERCVACRPGAPRLTPDELDELTFLIPDWERREVNGEPRLVRRFRFPDFAGALLFTRRVGELADDEGHHPRIVTEWGQVTVSWWTHAIRGLHRNDALMAAKTDALADED